MNEISKEQLLYMKRTRQHKQFVLFFQLFLFIFFIKSFHCHSPLVEQYAK